MKTYEAKQNIAEKYGYEDWEAMEDAIHTKKFGAHGIDGMWEEAMELYAKEFAQWIHRNSYEPLAVFPLETNQNWSSDDGETNHSTEKLFKEFQQNDHIFQYK